MTHVQLKLLIQELGLSQRQFAQKINLDPGYLSRILQGKSTPPERILLLIENTFHVNHTWLITGEGSIFAGESVSPEKRKVLELIDTLDDGQLRAVTAFLQYLTDEKGNSNGK